MAKVCKSVYLLSLSFQSKPSLPLASCSISLAAFLTILGMPTHAISLGGQDEEHDEEEPHGDHGCDNHALDQPEEVRQGNVRHSKAESRESIAPAAALGGPPQDWVLVWLILCLSNWFVLCICLMFDLKLD